MSPHESGDRAVPAIPAVGRSDRCAPWARSTPTLPDLRSRPLRRKADATNNTTGRLSRELGYVKHRWRPVQAVATPALSTPKRTLWGLSVRSDAPTCLRVVDSPLGHNGAGPDRWQ